MGLLLIYIILIGYVLSIVHERPCNDIPTHAI
jgi:hypothetical protein